MLQRFDEVATQSDADLAVVFIHEGEQYFAVFRLIGLAKVDQLDQSKRVVDRGAIYARRMDLSSPQCCV